MGGPKEGRVLAIGAHPDDVEFMMAGTLLLLGEAGLETHVWSLANGCCGTLSPDGEAAAQTRWEEARASAEVAGAVLHPPLFDDLAIEFGPEQVRRVASVLREVEPSVLLLPSPDDYMEDHENTSRLVVTAAFALGMPAYETDPPVAPWSGDATLYHAMPYGLRDGLRRLVRPGLYVDVEGVLDRKREMLSAHASQVEFLEATQGLGSYVGSMEEMCSRLGAMSGRFEYAEGWRRHSHLGFSSEECDPVSELLGGRCLVDEEYERSLG